MRISEITDRNIVWNKLSDIDVNFDEEYQTIVKAANLMIRLNRRFNFPILVGMIESFNDRIDKVLRTKYPDLNDPDIAKLKIKIQKMQDHINTLKSQLIF